MEKKTLTHKKVRTQNLLNYVNSGSQALFHSQQQAQELVSGKYAIKRHIDLVALFSNQPLLPN